ncbi:zinc finger CCCH-type containing 7Ba isoform X1 [Esox lucius]|uniref:C3H1-type domain-containing protein n=1 Tax=Esox lucius TaxID=8010 RepID=A0AAY5KK86_ESOLU|nr:zinc finger CCCH-type containing 7Ba isoform X1 [Esox lucius]
MDLDRQKRQQDIRKALGFIQSSLPYPDPQGYGGFLTQLVCNLLEEGSTAFSEGAWKQAIKDFSEGVNVAYYAQAESLDIPSALLESLYVKRAAAYQSVGENEQCVQDCDKALALNEGSCKALHRKALCLRELGHIREAYDCSMACLLSAPNDKQVNKLAQELANKLGLKIRKAYISTHEPSATSKHSNGSALPVAGEMYCDGLDSLSDISSADSCKSLSNPILVSDESSPRPSGPLVYSKHLGSPVQCPLGVPFSVPQSEQLGDNELMGDDLDSLLDCLNDKPYVSDCTASPHCDFPPVAPSATGGPKLLQFPSGLPAPTPRLPPAFFYSAVSQLNSLDTFPGVGGGDSAGTLDSLDTLNDLDSLSGLAGDDAPASKTVFDSLDALDSFSPPEGTLSANPVVVVGGEGLDSLSEFNLPDLMRSPKKSSHTVVKNGQMGSKFPQLTYNPLAATHDFKQACATCYSWIGPGVLDYKHQEHLAHRCQQNILLCRIKALPHPVWNRVRPRPAKQNFTGAFMLCKEVLESQVCKYGEDCTFAYCQEEVDVWTLERKEVLNRELLFERQGPNDKTTLSITRLLQLQNGMFMYLCGVCYDSRPRIISKRSKEVPSICSNLAGRHHFDDQKCLVHVVRSSSMSYTRIRPLNPLCQLEMCRRAVRYRCQRDHSCSFAHSVIELECWKLQQDNGITHEEIVQESKQHWNKQEQNAHKQKVEKNLTQTSSSSSGGGSETRRGGKGGGGNKLNLNMKYVCGLCWRDGLISEADKALKYCTAKARHSWTKDRRVLLVKSLEKKKWVMVRTLPAAKTYPHQYDICSHVVKLKKCHYIGNCTFAHSEEEKEVWTYMKNNGLKDMQQMYDIWLTMTKQNRQSDPVLAQNTEVKQIVMPTDYADPMSGFHCRLCGRHSHSERQWQQHISTKKHKERVFSCEGEDESPIWKHRFPGPRFALCPRLESECPEGASCDYAHGTEELEEWQERREFLRRKLAKAREDMLIMPDELDFGKYNFLLQD